MKDRHGSEDSRSLAESAGGQTNGGMSYVADTSFGFPGDDDSNTRKPDDSIHHQDVAIQEQKAVTRSKLLVALFLFLAACATAAVTYLYIEQQERDDFEDLVSD